MTVASDQDDNLYRAASEVLPGGVNAAARYNRILRGPLFIRRADGAHLFDHSERELVDFSMSNGASLLGHGHGAVKDGAENALRLGILCAHETEHQVKLANLLARLVPCAELVRFCGSGTEATWYAIRAARAFTGRQKVVKFAGHFHGYNDALAFNMRSGRHDHLPDGRLTPVVESSGMPRNSAEVVIVLPFNDAETAQVVIEQERGDIAAIILEPINYNSGTILPEPQFLDALRKLSSENGIVLIFDEILSGFQTGTGCAQADLGVTPDLATVGKALGGGLPLSALVGRAGVMNTLSPVGKASHTGTFIAPLVSILGALAALQVMSQPDFYGHIERRAQRLCSGLRQIFESANVPIKVNQRGARFSLLFGMSEKIEIKNAADTTLLDWGMGDRFFSAMYDRAIYLRPGWHHGISSAHTDDDINTFLSAAQDVVQAWSK